jgi:hypothetical protein
MSRLGTHACGDRAVDIPELPIGQAALETGLGQVSVASADFRLDEVGQPASRRTRARCWTTVWARPAGIAGPSPARRDRPHGRCGPPGPPPAALDGAARPLLPSPGRAQAGSTAPPTWAGL